MKSLRLERAPGASTHLGAAGRPIRGREVEPRASVPRGTRLAGPIGRCLVWALVVALGVALLFVPSVSGEPGGPPATDEMTAPSPAPVHGPPTVVSVRATGVINPVMAGYMIRGIEHAEASGAEAMVILLDTPGGLETSMREIIQAILDSDVPVVVYVYPPGGRAASAGLFITMAGHVAAMAPNTNIGSAHPVGIGGDGGSPQPADQTMSDKVTNDAVALIKGLAERRGRNAEWSERAVRESVNVPDGEALRLGVVDLLADDVPSLLEKLDGREVKLARGAKTLRTAGVAVAPVDMGFLERFLHLISDPNIAYILLTVGVYGLIYELASPGAVFPGVAGVLSLILAFYSLGMLPINYAGLVLIVFGFALLVAEVLVTPGIGGLAIGGVLSLLIGSLLLLNGAPPYLSISLWVIGTAVATTAGFFLILIRGVARTYRKAPSTGLPALIGAEGIARSELSPEGSVFVEGELWHARAANGPIAKGTRVEVLAVEGLTVVVRKV